MTEQGSLFSDGSPIREAFEKFHAENPHVYTAFARFTMEALARGATRVGAKAVWERMRWWSRFEVRGEAFKLNNNYTAYYARLFESKNPERGDVFEKREVG